MDWTELMQRHGRNLLLYARQWTFSREDAEEAVQDGFVRFWRSRAAREPEAHVPLLFVMVKRSALDAARRSRRRAARERRAFAGAEDASWFEQPDDGAARAAGLERALRSLPAEQREVIVLKTWGRLTFDEIGSSLRVPSNTAASRYRYAMEKLRQSLRPDALDE